MTYTPFHALSGDELLLAVANKPEATDLEIELALRLELLLQEAEAVTPPKRMCVDEVCGAALTR